MPLVNIVDHRKRPYRFLKVNAVVEATWHDHNVDESDAIDFEGTDGPDYEEKEHVSLADALAWANAFPDPVTLYLYDEDAGIYEIDKV